MSLFFIDAKVTGTDSTVISGWYPRCRSSAPNTAVVVVTSVQPISDSRTIRHAAGSASGAVAPGVRRRERSRGCERGQTRVRRRPQHDPHARRLKSRHMSST